MNHKTKIFTIVLIFIYLFICAIVISVAQDTTLSVTGFVVDETSGYPVSNHLVVVTVVGGGFNEDYEFYTNDAGYYGSEFIPAPGQGLVSAVTFDCLGVEHYQEEYFSPDNTIFVFDFEICTDTIPQGDCEADFDYIIDTLPSGAYLAQFFDLSIGEPDYWLWDFGDGEYSEEQNPEHIYYYPETYFVCLTIFNDTANCYDMYCKEVVVGNGGPDCENWFWYETNDNITFDFYGESFPLQADEWLWDFGDGNTTEGQDVSHTYNPNQGDLFNVSLITITYDPVFGDSCFAISYQWVMVGNSMNCEANYYFEQDTINEFTVNFFDSSTGIISNRYWDFGDGTFSEEINPVHSYSEPGSFSVCLSIYSDTLGFYCSDTYCTDVEILYSISSDFYLTLDTLSGLTNNYYFTDNSIGDADSWLWSFGDGNVSTLQNPVHQYEQSGEYEVCLEVSRSFYNAGTYTDTYCQAIETPNYWDFGGQVFIDGFPMNNYSGDTTVVDTGMAFLYRKYNNDLIPVDTNIFYQYGYYWFTQIREGDYIVKVGLSENSLNFNSHATSYHENAFRWDNANILHLNDTNYFVNVDMIELQGVGQGPGSISGFLSISEKDFINTALVSEVEILLLDANDNPLTFTITDETGNFAFGNIPLGSYKLYAEATGYISFVVSVYLDENNQTITDINLELYEQTVGTEEYFEKETTIGNIYPNPVKNEFYMDIQLEENSVLILDIFNINGQKVEEQKIKLNKGAHILSFDSNTFTHGVYFLSISSEDRNIIETRKFIK